MLKGAIFGLFSLAFLSAAEASGRPAGCPVRAWCGCYLSHHLGLHRRDLWLARNWARVGSAVSTPIVGAIVVWRNHVGKITAVDGPRIRVLSGNDSRQVKDRWRTTKGVIAYRVLNGGQSWAGTSASTARGRSKSGRAVVATRSKPHQIDTMISVRDVGNL